MSSVSVSGHRTHCFLTVPAGRRQADGSSLWLGLSFTLASPSRCWNRGALLVCTAWTRGLPGLPLRVCTGLSPPARPPHRPLWHRERQFPPRGSHRGDTLALRLSFHRARSSPDPLSTSSSLPFQEQGKTIALKRTSVLWAPQAKPGKK